MAHNPISSEPAYDLVSITPGASALAKPIRGFHVGVAGDVQITTINGTTVIVVGCLGGVYYPYPATHVLATSTTATSILGII